MPIAKGHSPSDGRPYVTMDLASRQVDLALRHGIVGTRTLMLDTGVAIVRGAGTIDLRDQRIDYHISAEPKHFTIGLIPTPIDITGALGDPSITVFVAEQGGRPTEAGRFSFG